VPPVLKTLEITPPSGSTVRYSYPDISVTAEWVYDPYIPGSVAVASYLSVDCENVLAHNRYGVVAGPKGRSIFHPSSSERGITRTNCVINQIEVIDADRRVLEVVAREVVPWVFHFTEGELSGAAPGGK
jgi:hypothetical protein